MSHYATSGIFHFLYELVVSPKEEGSRKLKAERLAFSMNFSSHHYPRRQRKQASRSSLNKHELLRWLCRRWEASLRLLAHLMKRNENDETRYTILILRALSESPQTEAQRNLRRLFPSFSANEQLCRVSFANPRLTRGESEKRKINMKLIWQFQFAVLETWKFVSFSPLFLSVFRLSTCKNKLVHVFTTNSAKYIRRWGEDITQRWMAKFILLAASTLKSFIFP